VYATSLLMKEGRRSENLPDQDRIAEDAIATRSVDTRTQLRNPATDIICGQVKNTQNESIDNVLKSTYYYASTFYTSEGKSGRGGRYVRTVRIDRLYVLRSIRPSLTILVHSTVSVPERLILLPFVQTRK
jgi:hypothetical protein